LLIEQIEQQQAEFDWVGGFQLEAKHETGTSGSNSSLPVQSASAI